MTKPLLLGLPVANIHTATGAGGNATAMVVLDVELLRVLLTSPADGSSHGDVSQEDGGAPLKMLRDILMRELVVDEEDTGLWGDPTCRTSLMALLVTLADVSMPAQELLGEFLSSKSAE